MQMPDPLKWGPFVISITILSFYGYSVLLGHNDQTLQILATAVSTYWVGSSVGSKIKDKQS